MAKIYISFESKVLRFRDCILCLGLVSPVSRFGLSFEVGLKSPGSAFKALFTQSYAFLEHQR